MQMVDINTIRLNETNPRFIKDYRFSNLVKSLQDFPEMMSIRPIIVNPEMMILGGNMRYRAAKEAGWTEVPIEVVDLPLEKQKEFIIKDNVAFGNWDWEAIGIEWQALPLEEWGLELPSQEEIDADLEWEGMPGVENEDKSAYRQIIVSFKNKEDIDKFAQLVGQHITDKTKSIWYPKQEIAYVADKAYVERTD